MFNHCWFVIHYWNAIMSNSVGDMDFSPFKSVGAMLLPTMKIAAFLDAQTSVCCALGETARNKC